MPSRVLLLTEDPDDRALAERELRAAAPDAELETADSIANFEAVLAGPRIELVVCEHGLGWIDSEEALARVRERHPQATALLFALAVDERTLANAVRAGFDDCVPKAMPHRARFSSAVRGLLAGALEREKRNELEQRYQSLFDHLPVGLFQATPGGETLVSNNEVARILGYEMEELQRLNVADLYVDPADRDRWKARLDQEDVVRDFEARLRRRNGDVIWTRRSARAVRDRTGLVLYYEGTLEDVTAQKQMEERDAASERRFRSLVENSADVFAIFKSTGVIRYISPSSKRVLQYEVQEMTGRHILDFVHADDAGKALDALAIVAKEPDRTAVVELRIRQGSGAWRTFEVTCRNLTSDPAINGVVANARDITDRQALQQQLWQAQKMEAVGRVAGGIAHDFNNLLTAISGHAQLALDSISDQDPPRTELEQIKRSADRAAGLTKQLLAFSRRQVLQPRVIELNAILQDAASMLRRLIGEHVTLTLNLGAEHDCVLADPGQIEQVLLNLTVNARDAMPGGGEIVVTTKNAVVQESEASDALAGGEYVVMEVADRGGGIDPAVLPHIFEPFFTTKPQGQGTGLGLSTVHGIITQTGGVIRVYSDTTGTRFEVFLPRAHANAEKPAPALAEAPRIRTELTILVVEDEDAVRALTRKVLERNGYRVMTAADGEDAMRVAQGTTERIDLLLTDVVMPGMNGRELVNRLQPLRPEMKVLYMSGYSEDAILHHGVLGPGTAFLEKPFTPDMLARKVRDVMEARPRLEG